jgi:hypothetical protein
MVTHLPPASLSLCLISSPHHQLADCKWFHSIFPGGWLPSASLPKCPFEACPAGLHHRAPVEGFTLSLWWVPSQEDLYYAPCALISRLLEVEGVVKWIEWAGLSKGSQHWSREGHAVLQRL